VHADGGQSHVAAVARETLDEAEAFAVEHRFHPVSFAAAPANENFEGAPHFGPQDDPKRHSAVPEAAAGVASVSPQVGAAPLTLPSGGTSS